MPIRLSALILLSAHCFAADWPQFRDKLVDRQAKLYTLGIQRLTGKIVWKPRLHSAGSAIPDE